MQGPYIEHVNNECGALLSKFDEPLQNYVVEFPK